MGSAVVHNKDAGQTTWILMLVCSLSCLRATESVGFFRDKAHMAWPLFVTQGAEIYTLQHPSRDFRADCLHHTRQITVLKRDLLSGFIRNG